MVGDGDTTHYKLIKNMKIIIEKGIGGLIIFVAVLSAIHFSGLSDVSFGANATPGTRGCTPTATRVASVGNLNSLQILATSSLRSYAIISALPGAIPTSTVFLAFNSDARATKDTGTGPVLSGTSTSPSATTTQTNAFGLNTDWAYTGAVQAITSMGSTSVSITECNFN